MIRVAYHTLGCKVNQYETEKIRQALENAGLATVPFHSSADAYIVNTCSVTSVADGKSRAAVRRALRTNPDAFVVVAGCYAELEPEVFRAIEGVDLVVPNAEKDSIAERVIARFARAGAQTAESEEQGLRPRPSSISQQSKPFLRQTQNAVAARPRVRTRAVVKVQDGCDQFCSYCIVPHARRAKWSRPIEDVLAEVRALAGFGYREIVLTGIRLGAYRSAERPNHGLADLVRAVAAVDGVKRVRLSSVEPWEVDDSLLAAMRSSKVCRHLHIPLQSGDDDVLARMNRPYTAADYRRIVRRVRDRIPGIAITTDVIVGFPGETENAFANTRGLIEELGFSRLHVFRYSPRKGTAAASMDGRISPEVKRRRAANLIELGKKAMRRFAESMVGQTLDVLVERRAARSNRLVGFTDNYIEVVFTGDAALAGRIVPVRIVGVDQDGTVLGLAQKSDLD